jgi:hypothetical protein
MEAIPSSEKSIHTEYAWRHIPEDGNLHSHRRENLKSYIRMSKLRNSCARIDIRPRCGRVSFYFIRLCLHIACYQLCISGMYSYNRIKPISRKSGHGSGSHFHSRSLRPCLWCLSCPQTGSPRVNMTRIVIGMRWGRGVESNWFHWLAYCTCPGWLWWWRIWWNEDWQYSEKTRPSAILFTTNPTWPDPGLNPGRRGGKPATNRLSYGAAFVIGNFSSCMWPLGRSETVTDSEDCYAFKDFYVSRCFVGRKASGLTLRKQWD